MPAAPTGVTAATAGPGSVAVSWTAPASSSTITSYTVTPFVGSTAGTPVTVTGSPPATSTTLSGLTNGTTYTFKVSATNSAGTGPASAASNSATPESSITCPCNVFGSQTPSTVDSGDGLSVNLGMAFTTDTNGYITGARFYKASTNTGTHVGSLWSASGTLLAQATFTGETASGWQQVSFSTPVAVTAGTTYIVSYYAPNGHYSVGTSLTNQLNAPPLYALASAAAPNGNGVYSYGERAGLPDQHVQRQQLRRRPGLRDDLPVATRRAHRGHRHRRIRVGDGQLDGARRLRHLLHRHPVRGLDRGHAGAGHRVAAGHLDHGERAHQRHHLHLRGVGHQRAGDGAVVGALQRRHPDAGTCGANRGHRRHGGSGCGDRQLDRARRLRHFVHRHPVRGLDGGHAGDGHRVAAGHLDHGERAHQRHRLHLQGVGHELGGDGAVVGALEPGDPRVLDHLPVQHLWVPDPGHGQLGRHVRGEPRDGLHHRHQRLHHRSPLLQGLHQHRDTRRRPLDRVGARLLAQATFTGETASGWQQVVVLDPGGGDRGHHLRRVVLRPQRALLGDEQRLRQRRSTPRRSTPWPARPPPNGNGVYVYGSAPAFPTSTFKASNYFVDAVFSPTVAATAPAAPTAVTAATAGPGSVAVSWTAPASSSTITSYTVTPFVGSTAGTPVTVTGSPAATSTTLSGLTNGTTYTFEVSATNSAGTGALSAASNSATPESSITCPCNVFGSQTPSTVDSGDGSSVNLGMAFTTDTNGYITGARFYKASTNTGTHVGSLWSASGTLLAQATFTGETASGWQQVSFSTPVAVTAGTTYIVSYYAPNGHYSVGTSLTNQLNAPPLYALASAAAPNGNGVYSYGSAPAYPTSTFSASNYAVDPVFSTTTS